MAALSHSGRVEYLRQRLYDPQSLEYLLSGHLQKFVDSWSRGLVLKMWSPDHHISITGGERCKLRGLSIYGLKLWDEASNLCCTKPLGWFWCPRKFENYWPRVTFQLWNILETWAAGEYWPPRSRSPSELEKGTDTNKPPWSVIQGRKFHSIMFFHKVECNSVESNLQRCFGVIFTIPNTRQMQEYDFFKNQNLLDGGRYIFPEACTFPWRHHHQL